MSSIQSYVQQKMQVHSEIMKIAPRYKHVNGTASSVFGVDETNLQELMKSLAYIENFLRDLEK